jgi:hypothetical protein
MSEPLKIWSYSGTRWSFLNNREWRAVPFKGLSDLCDRMKAESYASVKELCIVAHGDLGGHVRLDPPLTYETLEAHHKDIVRLRGFLAPAARVMFLACQAGKSEEGDRLFMPLSSMLAGCDVIGFSVANMVQGPVPGRECIHVQGMKGLSTRDDEWSECAKWALNGAIVRPPMSEFTQFQEHDPTFGNRCGSDACTGHGKYGDRCDPYKRRHWPRWLVSLDEIKRLQDAANMHQAGARTRIHGSQKHQGTSGSKRDPMHIDAPAHPTGAGRFKKQGVHGM